MAKVTLGLSLDVNFLYGQRLHLCMRCIFQHVLVACVRVLPVQGPLRSAFPDHPNLFYGRPAGIKCWFLFSHQCYWNRIRVISSNICREFLTCYKHEIIVWPHVQHSTSKRAVAVKGNSITAKGNGQIDGEGRALMNCTPPYSWKKKLNSFLSDMDWGFLHLWLIPHDSSDRQWCRFAMHVQIMLN